MKRLLRKIIYTVPGTQSIWVALNRALSGEGRPEFSGWGMVSSAVPPWWKGGGDGVSRDFVEVDAEVLGRVVVRDFALSMFHGLQDESRQLPKQLRELMWRHYFVFWSARYASTARRCDVTNLVECGVCDGLTAYFALSAVAGEGPFKAFLYDAWEGMKADALVESEQSLAGNYSYLSLENTQRNLARFERDTVFIKGVIPDSFDSARDPSDVAWLHIDLNSSVATVAVLNRFFDAIPPGGVILFDDYGWRRYYATKVAVDQFLAGKQGLLLPLPTGQAMFFKH